MIQLTVTYPEGLALDQLRVAPSALEIGANPEAQWVPSGPGAPAADAEAEVGKINSGVVIMVQVPEGWDRQLVTVEVEGFGSGVAQGQGQNQVVVEQGRTVLLSMLLGAPCRSSCMAGASQCVNDLVRFCRKDSKGCSSWAPPEICPEAEPYCSNGRCAAVCEEECTEAGLSRCVQGNGEELAAEGFQVCGQHDSDSCLDWGPQISCGAEQICSESSGQCAPACDGKPCPCSPGESQVCPDVGLCSGGVSSCESGAYGPCVWQNEPHAEECDGQDNNCDTFPDNGLVAPACDNQQGVCQGAIKKCGGTSGWLVCGTAEYSARAASQGLSYEPEETLCDGKDNDCDGDTDEHESCTCQPSCAGKACGADDGCGNDCLTGSCPDGKVCSSGKCECANVTCGSTCCAETEVCDANNKCVDGCSPACTGGKECVEGKCECTGCTTQWGTCLPSANALKNSLACGKDGMKCKDCSSGGYEYPCREGVCLSCKLEQYACNSKADCCSGLSCEYISPASSWPNRCCRPAGSSCTLHSDCCGSCVSNTCQ